MKHIMFIGVILLFSKLCEGAVFPKLCKNRENLAPNLKSTLSTLIKKVNGKSCKDAFAKLSQLRELMLMPDEFDSLEPLDGLAKLERLTIEKYTTLKKFPNLNLPLRHLIVNGLRLQNIDHFLNFKKLETLAISKVLNSHLKIIAQLSNLKELALNSGEIDRSDFLMKLTKLKELSLRGNRLKEIDGIAKLRDLSNLHIHWNQIKNLSPLSNLKKLTYLRADGNLIEDISPLANLTGLKWIYLTNNQIQDIQPLTALKRLRELKIEGNPIKDYAPVRSMKNIISKDF